MALTIDNLEIQIEAEATKATKGINSLAASLEKLQTAVGGSSGLPANLQSIATALQSFNSIGKLNLKSAANGIEALNKSAASLNSARLAEFSTQMQGIASGLSNLSNVGKSNISSIVNSVKKIPEITKALDPATVSAFSGAIQNLTEIMTPLGTQMDAIARGFNSLPNAIKRSIGATNKVATASKNATLSFNNLGTSVARAAARFWTLYYSVKRISGVFADAFNTSNDYIESLNLFKVSMGKASDAAMEYAEAVSDAMGIDVAEWITNQGNFMRMSTGFGIAADQSEIMSRNLTQLAYDMASFFNTDVETAMQKLQSGMSGQIKGLKEWGYNLSVAALQETALSLGIEQNVRSMTEAQKAQLRYITLIQKSEGVMGDMAKTINTPANSMRILEAMMTRLERAFGNIVSVLVTKYIPYIMAFVEIMEEMASAIAEAFGFEIPDLPENNLEMGAEVIEGIGDNAENSAEQIAELNKQLMGFDELNILKSNSDNKDASYDLGFSMPDYNFMSGLDAIDLEPYKEQLREILDLAKAISVAIASWKIGSSLFNGLIGVESSLKAIKTLLSQLAISGGLAGLFGGFALEVDGIIDTIKEKLNGLNFAKIFGGGLLATGGAALLGSQIANWIATAFTGSAIDLAITQAGINLGVGTVGAAGAAIAASVVAIIAGLPMYFVGIYDAIVNGLNWLNALIIPAGVTLAGAGIGAIIGACGGPIGAGVGALIGLAVGLVTDGVILAIEAFKNFDEIVAFFDKILDGAEKVIAVLGDMYGAFTQTPVGAWIDEHIVQPILSVFHAFDPFMAAFMDECSMWISWFSELFNNIEQMFDDVFHNIEVIASGCWTIIKLLWGEAWTWFDTNVIQPLSNLFSELWNEFIKGARWAIEWFGDIFATVWTTIAKGLSPIGTAFVKFRDAAYEIIKPVVNWIIDGLNIVITAPFNELNKALMWLKNLTILGVQPFTELKAITVPSIPLFAEGGFPTMGQMFIARERGPELVGRIGNKSAVANNDQIITGIASAVYSAMMAAQEDGNNGEGGSTRIVVQIGDQAVGEASVRYINGKIVQTGTSPIYA